MRTCDYYLQPFNLPERPINPMAVPLTLFPSSAIHTSHHRHSKTDGSPISTAQADRTLPASQPRQRPKLSLNTAAAPSLRTFGRGNTGLRLDTLAGGSPTVRNTYRNTYEPLGSSASILPIRPSFSTVPTTARSSSTSPSSSSSDSTSCSAAPYALPQGIHPILRNIPLPRASLPIMTSTPTSSSNRPLLFPPTRRVTFRPLHSLCEDIITTRFTARHQDLLDADAENSEDETFGAPEIRRSERAPPSASASSVKTKLVAVDPQLLASVGTNLLSGSASCNEKERGKMSSERAQLGDKRESSSPDSEIGGSDFDEDVCPKTPVAGRAKKRREWVWTLGPLEGQA